LTWIELIHCLIFCQNSLTISGNLLLFNSV
jgi:hypothetical protein